MIAIIKEIVVIDWYMQMSGSMSSVQALKQIIAVHTPNTLHKYAESSKINISKIDNNYLERTSHNQTPWQ